MAQEEKLLLGLCDAELDPRKHRSSFLTNKVGGEPDWPPGVSSQSPRCGRCGAPLALVVQAYCPLQGSPYHRTLHVFACCQPGCSGPPGSWTVLRSQCEEAPGRSPPPQGAPAPATDWCEAAEDWGMAAEELQERPGGLRTQGSPAVCRMDVSSSLQQLSLVESREIPAYRPFFISVVEESELCEEDDELEHALELLREYEKREGVAVEQPEESIGSGEKYEKTRARHGDDIFFRFKKTVSVFPQQILRYCRQSKPLFISKPPSKASQVVPACRSCGEPRTFELQLMPALVSLLERTDWTAENKLEFGTVLVYTCINSCWIAGSGCPVEEFCFVQSDPDQHLFKD